MHKTSPQKHPILALSADIGGTHTRLQITEFAEHRKPIIKAKEKYQNSQFVQFSDIITTFLAAHNFKVECACIAVAGPVINGSVELTNLPWHLSEADLAAQLHTKRVKLINDFEAIGYGAPILPDTDYVTLQKAKARDGAFEAIIGAGTGLGVAIVDNGNEYPYVYATEGGHVDFAPADNTQEALLAFLRKKFHRVSSERVVSGKGIENIYKFTVAQPEFLNRENPELKRLSHFSEDFAADIARFALEHNDPAALRTLDTFIRCYGTIAGNLALTTLPRGGLYIAGGIAPKLLAQLQDGRFMEAFSDKGRMSDLLKDIPVKIILNTDVGLTGAAFYAAYLT